MITLNANDRLKCFEAWSKGEIETKDFDDPFFQVREGARIPREDFPRWLHSFFEEYCNEEGFECPFAK